MGKVNFLVGFEIEFTLLKSSVRGEHVNEEWLSTTSSMRTGTPERVFLTEIADALRIGGVELQMFHAEAAPGQVGYLFCPPVFLFPDEQCLMMDSTN